MTACTLPPESTDLPAYTAGGLELPPAASLMADRAFTGRFWAKVVIVPLSPDECWIWTAATEEKGYGRFRCGGLMRQAHRIAYMLDRGYWPRSDRMILHSCDTPGCCNPAHLREGTAEENNAEMVAKGRNRWGKFGREYWRGGVPSENILLGGSKLSVYDVREIRRKAQESECRSQAEYEGKLHSHYQRTGRKPNERTKRKHRPAIALDRVAMVAALASEYNVSKSTIRDCVRRKTFAWVVGGG